MFLRLITLIVVLLLASVTSAQQAYWLELGQNTGIGFVITADGRFAVFTSLTKIQQTPPVVTTNIVKVVYVYEKDKNAVPPQVAAALNKINADNSGIVADEFEDDTVTGNDTVPEQYTKIIEAVRAARIEAKDPDLPYLAVQYADGRVVVHLNPKTTADVERALK